MVAPVDGKGTPKWNKKVDESAINIVPLNAAPPLQPILQPTRTESASFTAALRSSTPQPDESRAKRKWIAQAVGLLGQMVKQIKGKPEAPLHLDLRQKDASLLGMEVNGIADRLARVEDQWYPVPNRDLILLGQEQEYSAPVESLTIDGRTTPVNHENGQVVARDLNFGNTRFTEGQLNLQDGTSIKLFIKVITAL